MKPALIAILLAGLAASGCDEKRDSSPIPVASATPAPAPAPTATEAAVVLASANIASACTPACSSIERCEAGKCVANCPSGEVYVPATGPDGFKMGRGGFGKLDQQHKVVLTKAFCMDETEVTVLAYRRCVEAGSCTIPQLMDQNSNYRSEFHRDDHPINMVNWMQSKQYCESRGQALPTEAQFEWAAGHGDGRRYPWGDSPEPTCDNDTADFTPGGTPHADPAGDFGCHGGGTSKVKAHPNGNTHWPAGEIFDLGGNVWEWTADCYLPYPRETAVDPNPQSHPQMHGDCYVRALRGGGWNRSKQALNPSWRAASKRTYRVPALGFRCVRNPS